MDELVQRMTLDEKASLTAGANLWYLPPVERLGVPALKVSDGPSGVRGDSLIGRRSLSLPCGMAVGVDLEPRRWWAASARSLADEARSKDVHVLLGPTVCIVRTPLAGRTFESFSEDPLLTARLAVAYVRGVQAGGVGCCIKHFACNDQEHERMTISAEVDERALREIHLVAFEAAVQEAGVWSVMTAYNKVNGTYCCEQPDLLGGILRDEWGFDGLVMSDWFGTHSTAPAALAGLDLEMPGPSAWFGPTLAAAVRDGLVDESVLDGQVRHVLGLMERVGILGRPTSPDELEEDDPGRRAVARQVAAEGTVLLVNDGLLPLDPAAVTSVAVIGPNADQLAMGGGSSEVTPHRRRSMADALAERLPDAVVTSEVGLPYRARAAADRHAPRRRRGSWWSTSTARNRRRPRRRRSRRGWPTRPGSCGSVRRGRGWPPAPCAVRIGGSFTPDVSGAWRLGLESAGRSRAAPRRRRAHRQHGSVAWSGLLRRRERAGGGHRRPRGRHAPTSSPSRSGPGRRPPPSSVRGSARRRPTPGDEFERAVRAAAEADVAVVVVGSNGEWESEGHDRPDLSLPGRQRELSRPSSTPTPARSWWSTPARPSRCRGPSAGAVLMAWYPGEEGADALADIITGASEPSGRLPVTFPARVEDGPAGLGIGG